MRIHTRSSRIVRTVAAVMVLSTGLVVTQPRSAAAAPGIGPKRSIGCPSGAVKLRPRVRIQRAINRRPPGTTFCLRAGVYYLKGPITPKPRNRFIGQYGAVIDGSRWRTGDPWQALFRAHNENIDDVVIRNLVIRKSPQRGIHGYHNHSDGWVIENNDIRGNRVGISHGDSFQIRRNIIRGNWQYGIGSYRSTGSVIQRNRFVNNARRSKQFPGNAGTTKWFLVTRTIVRGNIFRDNHWHGIWFDTGHSGILIENNVLKRNGGNAIFHEAGGRTVIRNNRIGGSLKGVYIADAHDAEVYGNVIGNSEHAISLFRDGHRNGSDLHNNVIRDNTVRVRSKGMQPGQSPRGAVMWCSNLSTAQCTGYSTSRNNRFRGNTYIVPARTGRYWFWGMRVRDWPEWRADGQDTTGTLRTLSKR